MTLQVSDLVTPNGEIDPALFYPQLSGADAAARVTAYIVASATVTAGLVGDAADAAARAWIYYRAWSDVVTRLTLTPASTSLAGEVSTSFLQTQINEWLQGRDRWRAAYLALVETTSTAETPGVSRALATVIQF